MKAVVFKGPFDGSVEDLPVAYERFDQREDGWTKVLPQPGKSAA